MLALGNESLMDRTEEHRNAMLADQVAEVMAGDTDDASRQGSSGRRR